MTSPQPPSQGNSIEQVNHIPSLLVAHAAFSKWVRFWRADLDAGIDRENRRDLLLLISACIMQMTVFRLLVAVAVERWDSVWISLAVLAFCGAVLYRYWYKNLPRAALVSPEPLASP